ncbi:MAG: hypothetical protein QOD65_835 [Gaiellales bacterium]|jgi:hypothetical protein|nr:hypothetical protein [Gaiellales bacterium]MDX6596878.1 hypothetical protein [Gaiellales bacterium]
MTLAHAAAGAAIGRRIRSRKKAVLACVGLHGLMDLPGHEDLDETREGMLILATIALTGRLFGMRSREFWCAFACSVPDLEHVVLRGKRLRFYPTHRFARLHDALPGPRATARAQMGAALVALTLTARSARARARA